MFWSPHENSASGLQPDPWHMNLQGGRGGVPYSNCDDYLFSSSYLVSAPAIVYLQ